MSRLTTMVVCALLATPAISAAQPRIVNGVTSHGQPTTGALLYDRYGRRDSASLQCSGTLIGCNTFLTAAHCVIDDSNPSHYFVFLQHAGVLEVDAVVPHTDYKRATFPVSDVAVLHLSSTVTGIDPTTVNETNPVSYLGSRGTIVGFGQTLGTAGDYGIKRTGLITTESCFSAYMPPGANNTTDVCWTYAAPVGLPGTDSNTCNGDSGGPLLMNFGAGEVVAGVTSGGTNGNCNTTDHSYDANVYTYSAFVNARLGSDSTSACGPIPAVGTGDTYVIGQDGTLGDSNPDDTYSINLSTHANLVRFALNAQDYVSFDANLYVRYGAPATPSAYDCKAGGSGNFGGCAFELPTLGEWYVLVQRAAGSGLYQLTTTVFGGSVPVCGNDAAETGEQCDGVDDARCPGLCDPLTCACPAPSCGNDVTESGEQCDGSSAAGCLSGSCRGDCTCVPACGDDRCDAGERAADCPQDCGCSAAASCPYGRAPYGCFCDAACVTIGDCCPDACVACNVCVAGCGNGIQEVGEECDDGNAVDGDCCSSACLMEPTGAACDDGTLCTIGDQCSAQGRCEGQADVATTCFAADRAVIKIEDQAGTSRDRMRWSWLGPPVSSSDWGNPVLGTSYDLCLFDLNAGTPTLAVSAHVDGGFGWSPRVAHGWSYADGAGRSDGVQNLRLMTGVSSKITLKANGVYLRLPGPASDAGYFRQDPGVVAQLRNSGGKCWTSSVSESLVSTSQKFLGKTP